MTGATAITMWKCAHHKQSIGKRHTHRGVTEEQPVIPPLIKNSRKAIENSIGIGEMDIALPERQHPVVHFKRVGTAMIRVVVAKKKPK